MNGLQNLRRASTNNVADQTEDAPLLPEHLCENHIEEEEWRAEVMAFIHDHVNPEETYQLAQPDLEFGELLPEKPAWMEQDEYEERTDVPFQLERMARRR